MPPQRIEVVLQHSVQDLWQAYRHSTDAVVQRRIQFIAFLAEGKSREEAMKLTRYSLHSALKCIKLYNESGLSGLRDRRAENKGAPRLLDEDQTQMLISAIKEGYREGTLWGGRAVQEWVKSNFGLDIYPGRAYEYLKGAGFSQKRPRSVHIRGDEKAKEEFKGKR
jgi:transposase